MGGERKRVCGRAEAGVPLRPAEQDPVAAGIATVTAAAAAATTTVP